MSKRKLLVAALAAAMSLTSVSGVYAANSRTYHGSECEAYFGGQESFFHNFNSGIYNSSSVARWVSCPIAKDYESYVLGVDRVIVYIRDWQQRGQKFRCTLVQTDRRGYTVWSRTEYDGDPPERDDSIYIDGPDSRLGADSYRMHCNLPAAGSLVRYTVYEERQ